MSHFLAPSLGYPADGLSLPYQVIIAAGGMIYTIAGVWIFSRLLKLLFNTKTVLIILLLIIFGTNYLHISSITGTLLTHNFLFILYASLLFFTIKWHENPKYILCSFGRNFSWTDYACKTHRSGSRINPGIMACS